MGTLKSNNEEAKDIFNELQSGSLSADRFLKKVSSWAVWYSLSFQDLIILLITVAGVSSEFDEELEDDVDEFRQSLLDKLPSLEVNLTKLNDSMTEEDTAELLIQLIFAAHFTMFAIAQRNRTLNDMVSEVCKQPDESEKVIFEAVSIDPTIVANPEIADVISRWTLQGNDKNFDKLSRAIKGSYPRKRADYANSLRTMMRMLEEIEGEVTIQSLISVNELLELVSEGNDIYSSLQKHLHTRRDDTRRLNRDLTS
ncbi:hypothetical protein [Pseudidiomarina terrestris]|nr:hypothetical protein [Pseudidiomarina sp. 1APR75-15]